MSDYEAGRRPYSRIWSRRRTSYAGRKCDKCKAEDRVDVVWDEKRGKLLCLLCRYDLDARDERIRKARESEQ
jgi:Zn ribbon nucleic-acid-binding protein